MTGGAHRLLGVGVSVLQQDNQGRRTCPVRSRLSGAPAPGTPEYGGHLSADLRQRIAWVGGRRGGRLGGRGHPCGRLRSGGAWMSGVYQGFAPLDDRLLPRLLSASGAHKRGASWISPVWLSRREIGEIGRASCRERG